MQADYLSKQRFVECKTALLLHAPFFASLLLDVMDVKLGKWSGMPTLGTNGKTIWINEDYFGKLSLPEAVFAMCHEIGHAMWMHMDRGRRYIDLGFDGRPFSAELYNIAADYVINDMLIKCQVGAFKKEWLHDKKYTHDMLVDDVYRDLLKQLPPPSPKGGGGKKGEGEGEGGCNSGKPPPEGSSGIPSNGGVGGMKPQDTHVYEPAKMEESEMKRAIASAANQAKAMGKMPATLERFVEQWLQPKVSWRERMRYLVTRAIGRDSTTWCSPHRRRLVTQGVYLPSYTGFGAGEMVFVQDTSGSMRQLEYDAGMSELLDILQTCRPERVHVLSCDAKVHTHTELADANELLANAPKMKGGGGTRFEPAFEWVEEHHIEPCVLIYFTDLMGSFPRVAPPYPVIWVSTCEGEAPFGETIIIDLSDEQS